MRKLWCVRKESGGIGRVQSAVRKAHICIGVEFCTQFIKKSLHIIVEQHAKSTRGPYGQTVRVLEFSVMRSSTRMFQCVYLSKIIQCHSFGFCSALSEYDLSLHFCTSRNGWGDDTWNNLRSHCHVERQIYYFKPKRLSGRLWRLNEYLLLG